MEETNATTRQTLPTTSTGSLTLPVKRQKPLNPTPATQLSLDLMAEIVCRAPVKSLLRFRCVCKSCNSLISKNSKFSKKHLHISTTKPKLLLFTSNRSGKIINVTSYPLHSLFTSNPTQLDFSFINPISIDNIIASCDGLICFEINKSLALLWNPSTRKFKELPSLGTPPQANDGITTFSFGYDPSINNYKLVSVFYYGFESYIKGYKTQVKVHTLGTDSWRRIQDFPSLIPDGEPGIIVRGTVYWFAYLCVSSLYSRNIVSLDLRKESYKEISQPDYGTMLVPSRMGMLMDCLSLVFHFNSFIDVWLMKDCGNEESWIKSIRLPLFGDRFFTNIIYISEDDNHVLLNFKEDDKLKWVVYDSKNDTTKSIKIQDWCSVESKVYVESLLSP